MTVMDFLLIFYITFLLLDLTLLSHCHNRWVCSRVLSCKIRFFRWVKMLTRNKMNFNIDQINQHAEIILSINQINLITYKMTSDFPLSFILDRSKFFLVIILKLDFTIVADAHEDVFLPRSENFEWTQKVEQILRRRKLEAALTNMGVWVREFSWPSVCSTFCEQTKFCWTLVCSTICAFCFIWHSL